LFFEILLGSRVLVRQKRPERKIDTANGNRTRI
jgi:hypothetical protein